jgi:hypothetical protein
MEETNVLYSDGSAKCMRISRQVADVLIKKFKLSTEG